MGVAERRQREREQRRSTILRAAEDVFVQRGLAATTMDDIARAAEVSKGTLYLYFKSKDDLYLAIATATVEELLDELKREPNTGSGFEHSERLLKRYARFAVEQRSRFRLGISWLFTGDAVPERGEGYSTYRDTIGQVFTYVASVVERGKADGSIRPDLNALQVVFQLWAGTVGVLTLHMSGGELARRVPRQLIEPLGSDENVVPLFPRALEFDSLVLSFIDSLLRGIRRVEAGDSVPPPHP